MKYQDLCIKLSEVLRAKGVNTIYFEDVNLLNSEDVIYPAAVVQLVRVEQEAQSDRYTIMLTIANSVLGISAYRTNNPILITPKYEQFEGIGMNKDNGLYGTTTLRWCLLRPTFVGRGAAITISFDKDYMDWSFGTFRIWPKISTQILSNDPYIPPLLYTSLPTGGLPFANWAYDYIMINIPIPVTLSRELITNLDLKLEVTHNDNSLSRTEHTMFNIRGITDILANDERIQINSCVTTPFRWKFRDEVEGITAEINLSLFFDSNCN